MRITSNARVVSIVASRRAGGMLARRGVFAKTNGSIDCVIGVGANIASPAGSALASVRLAQRLLAAEQRGGARLSRVWRTSALTLAGSERQPDYMNAALGVKTLTRHPSALLRRLLAMEARFGRRRGARRWAPRPLDLDLLDWRGRVVCAPEATPATLVPHPRVLLRRFALAPMLEVAPRWRDPGSGRAGWFSLAKAAR